MPESAAELVHKLFNDLPAGDPSAFADLMDDDVVFEVPFASAGPAEQIRGREAVRTHLAERWNGAPRSLQIHAIHPEVHPTADPELFFVENEVELTTPAGERTSVRSSVNVVRVRDGKVTLFRDYMNGPLLDALAV